MFSLRRRAISIPSNGCGATPCVSTSPTSLLRSALDGVVAVVLAPVCGACARPLDAPTGGAICGACWNAIVPPSPLGNGGFPPHIGLATAIGPYDETLKAVVHALKYDRRATVARGLAMRMAWAGRDILRGADAVVPVPLHRARERERGFNQARELARHLEVPVLEALLRSRRTAAQADLPASRRSTNVHGAFTLARGVRVEGLTLVLVDDVSTTGATLNACAAPLLDAGAVEVRALTAAKATLKSAGASPR